MYAGNGAQIISPVDRDIAARIGANGAPWAHVDLLTSSEAVGGLPTAYRLPTQALLVRLLQGRGDLLPGLGLDDDDAVVGGIDAAVTDAYVAACAASQSRHRAANAAPGGCPLRVAYTAMHGVGRPFAQAMAAAFGLPPYVETPAQVAPDPSFPTVAYPNPEEGAGALALAMETAAGAGCQLILANDPDADRLAVAVATGDGGFRVLTGNEIGALLADWCWTSHVAAGGTGKGVWMAVSAVSSQLVAAMAAAEGFGYRPCLTGFKWMGNAMAEFEGRGERTLFSYEEAIGFACGDVVRDKDGVTAAAVFAEMAQAYARRGGTVLGRLAEIYAKYGCHVSNNGYLTVPDPAVSSAIFARLRNGGCYWARVPPADGAPPSAGQGYAVVGVRDLTATPGAPRGWDSSAPDGLPTLPVSSSGNMLTFTFRGAATATVTLRTSGTEVGGQPGERGGEGEGEGWGGWVGGRGLRFSRCSSARVCAPAASRLHRF